MSREFQFAGIRILFHWSLLFSLGAEVIIGVMAPLHLLVIPCLFLLISAHELGHLALCRFCRLEPRRIVLYPLWGIFYFVLSPSPKKNILVFLGGILAQMLLFALFLAVGISLVKPGTVLPKYIEDIYEVFIPVNVGIMFFNLLPFRGSDGWHIARQLRQLRSAY